MNTSAASPIRCYDEPSAGGLAPRAFNVLHEYASGPQGSARRSRDAAQRFRDEPSRIMRARSAMPNLKWYMGWCLVGWLLSSATVIQPVAAGQPAAYTQEHAITIDATTITPQSWWHVPGVTPSIYGSDPESMDAYKTTESRALKLKPGKYKFGSFTFDFPFAVNLDGKLDFAQSLDQCVEGRGTQTLTIRCSRTYPHGGQRDYQYQ